MMVLALVLAIDVVLEDKIFPGKICDSNGQNS